MNVKLVTFVTGQEVVCDYKEEKGVVKIKKPLQIVHIREKNGEDGVGFFPFSPLSEESQSGKDFVFDKSMVFNVATPIKEVENAYITTTTGIAVGGVGSGLQLV